jgi:hypothetical protein
MIDVNINGRVGSGEVEYGLRLPELEVVALRFVGRLFLLTLPRPTSDFDSTQLRPSEAVPNRTH